MHKPKQLKYIFILVAYVIVLHICYLCYFGKAFVGNYGGRLFDFDMNISKYMFSILESAILLSTVINIIEKPESLTRTCLLVLDLLYFAPGFVQCAVLNHSWGYIIYYFAF